MNFLKAILPYVADILIGIIRKTLPRRPDGEQGRRPPKKL